MLHNGDLKNFEIVTWETWRQWAQKCFKSQRDTETSLSPPRFQNFIQPE